MNILKQQIIQLYEAAIYFREPAHSFAAKILEVFGEEESRETRSKRQSRSRWKYLTMVADELNDRGLTFSVPNIDIQFKYTKDILYQVFWQEVRHTLYPEKKKQLNTKEFCNVVDHVMDLFSMAFDIHIPYPNIKDFLNELEAKNK